MKIKKIITLFLVLLLFTNCEKNEDLIELSKPLINTTWIGTETFNCYKEEGCTEQQIVKFITENEFTYQYIDGEYGIYDTILSGTYSYSHPELILQTKEETLNAFVIENKICLDSEDVCSETSSELLIKQ